MKYLCLCLLLCLSAFGARAEETGRVEGERCVGVLENGRVIEVSSGPEAVRLVGPAAPVVDHSWCWSRISTPELRRGGEPKQTVNHRRCEDVQIELRARREETCESVELVAAPIAMWREVPERLLPRVQAPKSCRLVLAKPPGEVWRVRALGGPTSNSQAILRGSDWTELPASVTRLVLRLQPASEHRIRVLDRAGVPVPDARLDLMRPNPSGHLAELVSFAADAGVIVIPALPGTRMASALFSAPGFVDWSLRAEPRALPRTLVLQAGAAVQGRFVDSDGQPLQGVAVEVETWLDPTTRLLLRMKAESGTDGSWRIDDLPAGKAFFEARSPGRALLRREIELSAQGTDLGQIVLPPGRSLHLLFVDLDGSPIPGAWVEKDEHRLGSADTAGSLEVHGLAPKGSLLLVADADGYLARKISVEAQAKDPLEIRLQPAFEVKGRFLDSQGEPLPGGQVEIRTGTTYSTESLAGDGGFHLELSPEKPIELSLRSPTSRSLSLQLAPGAAGELRDLGDLMAPDGLIVVGRVVDNEELAPIAGARLWLPRPSNANPLAAWFHGDLLESTSDAEGRFRMGGLERAAVTIRVEAPGFAPGRFRVHTDSVPEHRAEPIELGDLELSRGRTVEVEVTGEASPAAIARLDLVGQWREQDMLSAPVAAGLATFHHVPPGTVVLSIMDGRELLCEEELEISEGRGPLETRCRRESMSLTGVVRVAGQTVGPGRLVWLPPVGDEPSMVIRQSTPLGHQGSYTLGAGRPPVEVEVAADGFFASQQLRPGVWEVRWQGETGGSSTPVRVTLPRREQVEVAIDLPGHQILGRVLDSDRRPVAKARVRELVSGGLEFSADDGSFRFVALAAGEYYLRAEFRGEESPAMRLSLLPDQPSKPIELILGAEDELRKLEILALDASNKPIGGAFVFVDLGAKGLRILTTGWDGVAQLRMDPPLPETLRLAGWAAGTWQFSLPVPVP